MTENFKSNPVGLLRWQQRNVVRYLAWGALAWFLIQPLGLHFLEMPVTPISIVGAAIGIFASFRAEGALARHEDPTKASRPFDQDRNGIVVAEGGCLYVLERLDVSVVRRLQVLHDRRALFEERRHSLVALVVDIQRELGLLVDEEDLGVLRPLR